MKNSTPRLDAFVLIILFIQSIFSTHSATDTINKTQIIKDAETLVSRSDVFVLGFFHGGNGSSTKTKYLGIWYTFSNDTVVWVANRQNPVTDSSGVLQLTSDGHLIIVQNKTSNISNGTVWSSDSRGRTNDNITINPIAKLLDSGNLIITNGEDGDLIWQSFDYPSDTCLPGSKIGFDKITGHQWKLTAWKQQGDPSLSDYVSKLDTGSGGSHEMVTSNGDRRIGRLGIWNGRWFTGVPSMVTHFTVLNFTYVDNQTMAYYSYNVITEDLYHRLTVFPNSGVKRMTWSKDTSRWISYWSEDTCDSYSVCGPNSICNIQQQPRICDCYDGFHPKSNTSWNNRHYLQGCEMKEKLNCSSGENDFKLVKNIKLPDATNSTVDKNISLDACKVRCTDNCSCTAYAPHYLRDIAPRGCILWFGDLIDTKLFNKEEGMELYLRLPISEFPNHSSGGPTKTLKIIVVATVVSGLIVLSISIWIWKKNNNNKIKSIGGAVILGMKEEMLNPDDVDDDNRKWKEEPTLFEFSLIASATQNFSGYNKIGQGGFGSVYKGTMRNGQEIAVKRLSNICGQGLDEFMNEVMLITKLQHKNLIRLLGCCTERSERILVYEFMQNKSLDSIIFGENKHLLDWKKRVEIIIGIARGLLYLHHDSRLKIIHRDLKAGNVLLDEVMNPKISDFGTARLFRVDQMEENTRRVIGTYGYMSPEYAMNGIFSMKSDVFSFGVLLLEIISGKSNRLLYKYDLDSNLLDSSWRLCQDGKGLELLDESLKCSCSISQCLHFIRIGLLCVQQLAEDRPDMSSVVFMLSNENSPISEAKRPSFGIPSSSTVATERYNTTSSSLGKVSYTMNDMDFTDPEIR